MNRQCCELLDIVALATDNQVTISGADPVLPTRFALGETAAGVLAAVGLAAAEIWTLRSGGETQAVHVDVRHAAAALNSYHYHRVKGGMEPMASLGLADLIASGVADIYPTRDGRYFHTHPSFDPEGMCAALGVTNPSPEKMARAVRQWEAQDLEDFLADEGRCGAMIRSADEWDQHAQGRALAAMPVVEIVRVGDAAPEPFPEGDRPLGGIRALDLTRVLAGPTCARTLAEHGAQVLHIGAEHLPTYEGIDLDTGHGKRWANLDLKTPIGRDALKSLVAGADVFCEGYRPGVMQRLGFSPKELREMRPGIVNVSINCYGHSGPFANRPGYEQLGQSVSGVAYEQGGNVPQLAPAAFCDYTSGYLAAFGALVALLRRAQVGGSYEVRVSLTRTAMWYMAQSRVDSALALPDASPTREEAMPFTVETATHCGELLHLAPAVRMSRTAPRWELPSPLPGSARPAWPT